ncbi:lysophospholipid acyltransferase family protein [Pannonibacter phragmitetus]|uniref:lysophospholipid acyltransferase family protein n=1 Tax=Pannonibacter phragmitetus TaxID=121719 RepID=UPI000F45A5A4|nr:lysophospholipid acyltransferase family protein [Pannonibacter phragmitetus]MBA4204825.1 1-acyl-sn-glycerol-3-phosphate acyltransferase [Polymorphum sp.]
MQQSKAVCVIFLLTIVSLILIPLQWLAMKAGHPVQRQLPYLWHRIATRLVGIRITQKGKPATHRPLLIVANHASWVDITVLGAVMPLSFIAKSEVEGWPILGLFAKLQRTVFVNRTRRTETGAVASQIAGRMASGDAMVLFAEGTSNDGNRVLPFRSALLGAATKALENGAPVEVQPLSIVYARQHGIPLDRRTRARIAWYGDMELGGHLWGVFCNGAIDVELTWGEPVEVSPGTDRKALTASLHADVERMTITGLTGREPLDPEAGEAEVPASEATQ